MNKNHYYTPLAVKMAHETISMHKKIQELLEENERLREYEQKYRDLLRSSTAHSGHMMTGMMDILLKPGVADALFQSQPNSEVEV